jgi:hypothetical protein
MEIREFILRENWFGVSPAPRPVQLHSMQITPLKRDPPPRRSTGGISEVRRIVTAAALGDIALSPNAPIDGRRDNPRPSQTDGGIAGW